MSPSAAAPAALLTHQRPGVAAINVTSECRLVCWLQKQRHFTALPRLCSQNFCPEQVPGWTREQLLAFWKRWYVPANATLFIVGDFDRPIPQIEALIHKIFDPIPAGQSAPE